jgi:hypothetical protein
MAIINSSPTPRDSPRTSVMVGGSTLSAREGGRGLVLRRLQLFEEFADARVALGFALLLLRCAHGPKLRAAIGSSGDRERAHP